MSDLEAPLLVENNNQQVDEALEETSALSSTTPVRHKNASKRIYSMDLLRGLLVMVMAWDHCKDILMIRPKGKRRGGETWSGEMNSYGGDGWQFVARGVSHICAPGFFFTMGTAMVLFTLSRLTPSYGWSLYECQKHFIIRGLLLIFVGRMINVEFALVTLTDYYEGKNVTSWSGGTHHFPEGLSGVWDGAVLGSFQVMTGLGLTMLLAGAIFLRPFINLYKRQENASSSKKVEGVAILLALIIFAISNTLIVYYQGDDQTLTTPWPRSDAQAKNLGQQLVRMLLIPGHGWGPLGNFSYPVIPWIGITILGMGFGFVMKSDTLQAHKQAFVGGLTFLFLFFVIRFFGGKWGGNIRGWPRGDNKGEESVIQSFFAVCKYPPSLAYTLLTVGIDLVWLRFFSLSFFSRAVQQLSTSGFSVESSTEGNFLTKRLHWFASPFLAFGRSPLFFYTAHFIVYSGFGIVFHALPKPILGLTLQQLFPVWVTGLIILYPLCNRYYKFKSAKDPHSLWRLF